MLAPKYLSFDELLQKRLFEIPSYQRAYSWDTKQRKDLFNDIEKLHLSNVITNERKSHFMATVVCHNENRNEAYDTELYNILNIVDGQQRITTLIILLKAIEKKLVSLNNDNKYNRSINYINDILVKDDNKRLVLIQTNHSSSIVLREYLVHGTYPQEIKIHAVRALNGGFKDCEAFVDDWCFKYDITSLLILIRNDLYFILHILEDEASVYTVFEVLNSRGLAVDWLDKCKSMLMGIAFEKSNDKIMLDDKLHWLRNYWSKIYEEIGILNIDGKEIVSFAATLFNPHQHSKIMKIDTAIDYFKEICLEDVDNVLEVSKWLYDVTSQLKTIELNIKKKAVNKVIQARFLQVAINLSMHIDNDEQKKLLEIWELTTFRVFGLFRKDSRHLVGEYVRLGHNLMGFGVTPNQYANARYVTTKDKLTEIAYQHPLKDIGRIFKEEKSYGIWNQELRYFLYHYEMKLSSKNNTYFSQKNWDIIWSKNIENTIEHIYPQQDTDKWKGKVSKNKDLYRHMIGNLILLPTRLNLKASNDDFKTKVAIYNSTDINAAKEVGQIYSDWNYQTINERTENLIKFAQSFWSIDGK